MKIFDFHSRRYQLFQFIHNEFFVKICEYAWLDDNYDVEYNKNDDNDAKYPA